MRSFHELSCSKGRRERENRVDLGFRVDTFRLITYLDDIYKNVLKIEIFRFDLSAAPMQ
jgi:hypothetical protein